MEIFKIYIIKNIVNDKVYIGQTFRNLNKRWNEHLSDKKGCCRKLFNAFNKYGRNNFYIEELINCKCTCDYIEVCICGGQDVANNLEDYFVELYGARNRKSGYNIRYGGRNGKPSKETLLKMSKSKSHKPLSSEHKLKLSIANKGKKRTEEQNKANSLRQMGKRTGSENPNYGKGLFGKDNGMFNKKHSKESTNKISESKKGLTPWNKGKVWKIINGKRIWINKE